MGDFRFSVNEPGARISTIYTPIPVPLRSPQTPEFHRSVSHLTGSDATPRVATPTPVNVAEAIKRQQQQGSGLLWTNVKDRERTVPVMKIPTGRTFPDVQISIKNNRQGSSKQRLLGTMRQDSIRRLREPEERYRPSSSLSSPWLANHIPGINNERNEGTTASGKHQFNGINPVRHVFGNNTVGDHNKALAWTRSLSSGGRTRPPPGGVYLSSGYGLNDRIREKPPPLSLQRSDTFSFHFPIRSVEADSKPLNDYYRGKPRVGHFRFTSSSDATPSSETSDTDTSSDVTAIHREIPVVRETPIQRETPTHRETNIQSETSTYRETPIQRETPIHRETSTYRETPIQREIPIHRETPVHREIPVQRETPIPRAVIYKPTVRENNLPEIKAPSGGVNGTLHVSVSGNPSDLEKSFEEDIIVPSSPVYPEKLSQHLNDISSNRVQTPIANPGQFVKDIPLSPTRQYPANYSQFSPKVQDMLNRNNLSMSDYFTVSVSDYDTDTGSNFSVSTLERSNSELDSRMLTSARRRKRKEKNLSVRFNMCNQVHEYEPTRNSPHYMR